MKVDFYTRRSREVRGDYMYAVCLFVSGNASEIDNLAEVQYILHPSFPDPVRYVSDAKHCFALETEAWGGFEMSARLFSKDGADRELNFQLMLQESNWPTGPRLDLENSTEEERVAFDCLLEPKWEWRKISTVARRLGCGIPKAIEILESFDRRNLARRAPFESLDNEQMWGATARVGLMPEPQIV